MVAEVIVDIGDQHVEDDAPIKGLDIRFPLCAVLSKGIDDLRIAAALTVLGAHHRHRRQERDADRAVAIEAPRQHEASMLVNDRGLRAPAAERRTGGKDELEILICFFIPENPLGDLERPAELDQGRNAGPGRCLENVVADPAEMERA